VSLDIESYEFQGDELLDRLDNLNAAIQDARSNAAIEEEINTPLGINIPENYSLSYKKADYAEERLRRAHRELDSFFEQETTKFPIETLSKDENGNQSRSVTIMNTEADSFEEIATSFQEINGQLTDGDPTTRHHQVPSMITAVDYSQYLVDTWEKLQATYHIVENL
jgi:hypothetical protein